MPVPDRPEANDPDGDERRDGDEGRDVAAVSAAPARKAALLALARRVLGSRLTRYGFVAVTISLGAYAVSQQWTDIHGALDHIGLRWSAAALAFVLAALFTSMLSWRALLAGLGSPLPVSIGARIMFVGQLGKYLPGSVWPVLAQMEIATAHKVPRHRTALASVLTMLVAPLPGPIIALGTLPFTRRS